MCIKLQCQFSLVFGNLARMETMMSSHSRRLSFTTPIFISFAGIILCFVIIATLVTIIQRNDIIRDYHSINRNFTHNGGQLHRIYPARNDYILGRAATYLARNDELNRIVNINPEQGLQSMMQLLSMMPTVSSLSIADTEGHYLRAPQAVERQNSPVFNATTRPGLCTRRWDLQPLYPTLYRLFTQQQTVTLAKPVISTDGKLRGTLAFHFDLAAMSHTLRQMRPPVQGSSSWLTARGWRCCIRTAASFFQPVVSSSCSAV